MLSKLHMRTHPGPRPDLRWLSCRMGLLGDQIVSFQPLTYLNISNRKVPSASDLARKNIEGHTYPFQLLTVFILNPFLHAQF